MIQKNVTFNQKLHKLILQSRIDLHYIKLTAGGESGLNTTTITVGSVTYAIKVRKLLERSGIKSKLVKVDSSKSKNGCTYGIQVHTTLFYDVINILKNSGINYSVYNEL